MTSDKPKEKIRDERETRGIKAIFIIDVIGKPPEHLIESLENICKSIDEEKGVSVTNKKIKEPVIIEKYKDRGFYTSFAEIEIDVEEIANLAILLFKYMPAHVEIIEPELIALTNNGWGDILSELTRRLHGYDEIAKILQAEKGILQKKLKDILEKQKSLEEKKVSKKPPKKKSPKKK